MAHAPHASRGSAKESQVQPPHHSIRAPITEKPSGIVENR
jgi:hypothetical protein